MALSNNPVVGATYLLRGLSIIARPGMRRFVAMPLLINIGVYIGLSALLWAFGISPLIELVTGLLPDWLDWLAWLLLPVLAVIGLVLVFFTFNLVANLIAAPFNSLLAEAVERELTGRELPSGDLKAIVSDIVLTVKSELGKLMYILPRTLPLMVLVFVPVIGFVASLVLMLLSAWMLAFAFSDYPMGNHRLGFSEQRALLRGKRLLSLGFGGSVMAAMAIPILNFLVIPCAVAGATAMWVDHFAEAAGNRPRLT